MRFPFRGSSAATAAAPAPARASVDAGSVAQHFNFEWAVHQDDHPDLDTYWWWVVSVRLDPNEVWMEADDGALWVIPFETDGVDITSVGEPAESRLVAVPVTAADGATASAAVDRRRQRVLATVHDRPVKPDPSAAERPNNEEVPVGINIAALRQRLGISATELPDDATEEQVNQAVLDGQEGIDEPTGDHVPGSEEPDPPTPEPNPAAPGDEPTTPAASAGEERTIVVDRTVWERTQAQVDQLSTAARASEITELDTEADAAVRDGRITPASRAQWRASIDPGESPSSESRERASAERAALAALPAGRVPTSQRGTSTTDTANPSLARALSAVPTTKRKAA